jgi:hypothetical protein
LPALQMESSRLRSCPTRAQREPLSSVSFRNKSGSIRRLKARLRSSLPAGWLKGAPLPPYNCRTPTIPSARSVCLRRQTSRSRLTSGALSVRQPTHHPIIFSLTFSQQTSRKHSSSSVLLDCPASGFVTQATPAPSCARSQWRLRFEWQWRASASANESRC